MTKKAPPSSDIGKVTAVDRTVKAVLWHPQWGGYVGVAEVSFGDVTGSAEGGTGCFHVTNWHDGDFPIRDGVPDEKHYCDAAQLIDFGLKVLELQAVHQKREDGNPVLMPEELKGLRDRIDALIARPVTAEEQTQ